MLTLSRASLHALVFGLVGVTACGGGAAGGSGGASAVQSRASEDDTSGASGSDGEGPPPAGPPTEVDCGDFSTCAIASDGVLRCWGRDKEGELGNGKGHGEHLKRTVVPGLGKVKRVALASRFGCALLEDKTVKCWGTGRIANDGKSYSDAKPVPVAGLEQVEELAASGAVACARGARGVVCWGTDDQTIGSPPKGAFKQVSTGFTHACGLDGAGAVACWGSGDWGPGGIFAKPAITGALQVVTGDRHGCVLTKGHTVQCWGMNDASQLGTKSNMEPHKKPVTVPGVTNVVRLAAGEASTCALLRDGSVRCWGANGEGELGLGTRSPDERPSRVTALSEVEQLCLASAHGCALTKEQKLLCWGSNAFGQLGDGTKERRAAPTPVIW